MAELAYRLVPCCGGDCRCLLLRRLRHDLSASDCRMENLMSEEKTASKFIDSFGYCQLCGKPGEECECEPLEPVLESENA